MLALAWRPVNLCYKLRLLYDQIWGKIFVTTFRLGVFFQWAFYSGEFFCWRLFSEGLFFGGEFRRLCVMQSFSTRSWQLRSEAYSIFRRAVFPCTACHWSNPHFTRTPSMFGQPEKYRFLAKCLRELKCHRPYCHAAASTPCAIAVQFV